MPQQINKIVVFNFNGAGHPFLINHFKKFNPLYLIPQEINITGT